MDLEKINNEYLQFKKDLQDVKNEKEKIAKQLSIYKNDIIILQASKANAELNNDTSRVNALESALEQKKQELEKIHKELVEKKAKMVEIQVQIEDRVGQVRNNPDLKSHLDAALTKRYTRSIKRINDEKTAAVSKKENFIKLDDLAEKHQSVKKNLIGMTNAQKEIKALNEELNKLKNPAVGGLVSYKDSARAAEITTKLLPIARGKYDKNKDLLTKYAKTQNLDIKEAELLELTGALALNKGNINIKGTIEKQVQGINKQIKGYNKQILNLSNAVSTIDKTAVQRAGVQVENNTVSTPVKTGFFSKLFAKFKDWRNRSSQKALNAAEPVVQQTVAPTTPANVNKKNEFAASLKYDIVKDELAKREKEGIKEGKEQRKQPENDIDRD